MYQITLITLIAQACQMGSRVIAALFAIELEANPLLVGMLISMYSLFPVFCAVYSGRISDRLGTRRPMLAGMGVLGAGLLVPFLIPTLPALYVSAALVGVGFVFFNVSNQNLAGGLGPPEQRARNFSTQALGYAGGHLVGPVTAGYAIEYVGFTRGYLIFALLMLLPIIVLAFNKALHLPPQPVTAERKSTLELWRAPALRRAVIIGGLMTTGWDLYTFYVPIYGHSIGLSASTIGNILGMFAAATFVVRVALPVFTRRFGVEPVLTWAMFIAAALFLPFPLLDIVPVLFILSFGIGLTLGCGQPLTLTLAYNNSPPGRSGEVTGLRLFINNVTHIGVPLAAGALGAALGVAPVFWTSAAILCLTGHLTHRTAAPGA
ncbi:MAG: MFS transporter [Betaproteobacteria bacterium]|nr:MAG: MFS transporter [Betaproteobacteria bacterium]